MTTEPGLLADRLPPQNLEAEVGVLGSVLLDNDALHDVIPLLAVEDFYRDTHQVIYRAIRDLYDLGGPIDLITLADELTRRNQCKAIGGSEALAEILGRVPHAANARYYAQIVRQKSINRDLIECGNQMLRDGYSNNFTSGELLESAEKRIFSIAEADARGVTINVRTAVPEAMDRIYARVENRHVVSGVATGFFELDDLVGGFQPAQVVVLASRPSMGKTALALNICEHAAFANKTPVLFVSLEMGHLELVERLLSSVAKVDGHKLRTGRNLRSDEFTRLADAREVIDRIFIDETPERTMRQIVANGRRFKRRENIGLIVVDYIQLIDGEQSRDSRQEQIALVSRRLKVLARAVQVPVLALSQLNRRVEDREDRKPRLSDLRESGAIEQDADVVLLLNRPEVYDPNDEPGIAEVHVAKNRNGPVGTVKLAFLKNITRFENLAVATF